MAVRRKPFSCSGHEGVPTLVIEFFFAGAVQTERMPRPGVPFAARERVCYYPDTESGRRAVSLIRQAFVRGVAFRVGDSRTTVRALPSDRDQIAMRSCTRLHHAVSTIRL